MLPLSRILLLLIVSTSCISSFEGSRGKQTVIHSNAPLLHKRLPVVSTLKTLLINGHPYKAIVYRKDNKYRVKVFLSGGKFVWLRKKPAQSTGPNKGVHGVKVLLSRPVQPHRKIKFIWRYQKPVNLPKGKHRHKTIVLRAPVLKDKNGVPHKTTAKETGETYLTGHPLRILDKNNTFDTENPFLYFPIIPDNHEQGR